MEKAWLCGLLGWHVCRTKLARNVRATNFHTKNAPTFSRFVWVFFCGSEKSGKIPTKIPVGTRIAACHSFRIITHMKSLCSNCFGDYSCSFQRFSNRISSHSYSPEGSLIFFSNYSYRNQLFSSRNVMISKEWCIVRTPQPIWSSGHPLSAGTSQPWSAEKSLATGARKVPREPLEVIVLSPSLWSFSERPRPSKLLHTQNNSEGINFDLAHHSHHLESHVIHSASRNDTWKAHLFCLMEWVGHSIQNSGGTFFAIITSKLCNEPSAFFLKIPLD